MTAVKRIVLCLLAITVLGFAALGASATAADAAIERFQRFATGREPVQEAVVYRKVSESNGKIVAQEWLRFGYQGDTYYMQYLKPDTNNPARLAPVPPNRVWGASRTHLWIVSDEHVKLAEKAVSAGSLPERYGAFPKDMMLRALALGVPTTDLEGIRWSGADLTARVVTRRDPRGKPLETNLIHGTLALGPEGLPVQLTTAPRGGYPGRTVVYEYSGHAAGLPFAFTQLSKEPGENSYRYEFLTLKLGEANLAETDGYVPMMFADKDRARMATVYTNRFGYTVTQGGLVPAFETVNPRSIGTFALGGAVIGVAAFLMLWYRRSKQSKKDTDL